MLLANHITKNLIWVLIIVLSVSCRGSGVMKVAEFAGSEQTLPRTITLVNWNAQKGANRQLVSDLARLLELENPDIVFLQEARSDLIQLTLLSEP